MTLLGDLISAYEIEEEHAAGDELNIELESDPAKDVRRILRPGSYFFERIIKMTLRHSSKHSGMIKKMTHCLGMNLNQALMFKN